MEKNRRSKPLAVTLFAVVAMAILIACGGGGTTESAKSSVPKPAPGSESPLAEAEAVTKAIESLADEAKTGPASAIAALIQAAEIQAAPLAETITKEAERVVEEVLKASTFDAEKLAEGIAKAVEATEPLMETVMEAVEALTKDLTDTAATVMSDAISSDAMSAEDLAKELKDIVEDSTVQTLLSETLTDAATEASAEQESAPALVTTFDQFGFTLTMDLGSVVQTAQGSAGEQGAINFPLGEVNSILTWVPQEGSSPLALVSGTYDILKANQTGVSFDSINDGEITVSGQSGVYLGFKSTDDTGASLGGGLIGAWTCTGEGTAYTLTLTGADASTLQIRFDRVLENFTCAA